MQNDEASSLAHSMPEFPDITVYIERLAARLVGQTLERVRLLNPFILRTVAPPAAAA